MTDRADIVAKARAWIGTPFLHRGRSIGLGVDCAGLLICICRDLGLVAGHFDVPPYSANPDGRTLREGCERWMRAIPAAAMQPGDAVLLIVDAHPQHLGLLGDYRHGGLSIIHASNMAHPPRVIETRLMFHRRQRLVAAFALPGID